MSTQRPKRTGASHVYAIVSTTLVLFLVGIAFLIFLHGSRLVDQFKESIEFSVILKDDATEAAGRELAQQLSTNPFVQRIEYVSKAEAAERYIAVTGDDFRDVLDANPLFASINISMKADYATADSLVQIEANLLADPAVAEFYYDKSVVDVIDKNVRRVGLIVAAVSFILLLITVFVIDSTMRLAMFANRFTIRSMQLVGATRWFIVKPFLARSVVDGLISAVLAVLALALLLNVAIQIVPELYAMQDFKMTGGLFGLVAVTGIAFTLLSTYLAVSKYLKMKLDELY